MSAEPGPFTFGGEPGMSGSSGQARARTAAFRRRIGNYYQPDLRVSDAERAEVADRLGKHYGDGRLDQDEFNERVERAMRAKTQSDLAGLFDDLPPVGEPAEVPARRVRRSGFPGQRLLFIVALIVFADALGRTLTWVFFPPWVVIGLLAAVVVYVARPRSGGQRRQPDRTDRT